MCSSTYLLPHFHFVHPLPPCLAGNSAFLLPRALSVQKSLIYFQHSYWSLSFLLIQPQWRIFTQCNQISHNSLSRVHHCRQLACSCRQLPRVWFCLAWPCAVLVHIVTVPVTLHVHLPSVFRKHCFNLTQPFLPLFWNDRWALGEESVSLTLFNEACKHLLGLSFFLDASHFLSALILTST